MNAGELADIMRRMGRRPSDDEMEEGIAGPFRKADFDIDQAELDFSQFVVFLAGTSTKAQRSLKKQIRDLREVDGCVRLRASVCARARVCARDIGCG